MTINSLNQNNNIPFSGLSRQLSKYKFQNKDNVKKMNALYPKSLGIVGNLPSQWLKNMPMDERPQLIPFLYKALGEVFKSRCTYFQLENRAKELITVLKKYKAIKPDAEMEYYYIKSGAYGEGFRLKNTSDGTDFFVKNFHEESPYDRKGHGAVAECNTKIFLKHNVKQNKEKLSLSKFYYGDINNGYYIEDFIPCAGEYDKDVPDAERTHLVDNFQKFLGKFGLYHNDCNYDNYKIIKADTGDYIQVFDVGGIR